MDKIYNVQKAIIMEDEVVLVLLDTRYNAVMVIKPGDGKFIISEPDGEERLSWLLRLSIITADQAQAEADKLEVTQKRKLIERLQEQIGAL